MDSTPEPRSVKIGQDERTGWSSDRPRRDGAPPRPADISTRCRVLRPSDRMRYSPGSLLIILSADATDRDAFADRVIEERGALLSIAKVRALIAGRVPEDALEDKARELLDAAVAKRLESGDTVVLPLEGLEPEDREPYLHAAAKLRRPRHAMLLDVPRDQVPEELRPLVNELRRALDAGDLGQEGFQTAARVGGSSATELKRIVFRPPPRED